MSKVVLTCSRDGCTDLDWKQTLNVLSRNLMPDNIDAEPPRALESGGVLVGILNPNPSLRVRGGSVCAGQMLQPEEDWWRPRAKVPDGSYALFRCADDAVELVSDTVASRTIWYVLTEEQLVASTSQRAIVSLMRSYLPNRAAFSWMLSCGSLGPGLSWDRRLRCLRGSARLLLDRSTWKLTETRDHALPEPVDMPAEEHKKELTSALGQVLGNLQLDLAQWVLALSGGFDSRCILLGLREGKHPRCVTWGLGSALSDRLSDGYIAKRLAEHLGLEHTYFDTGLCDESFDRVFHRYLVAGEGRVDRIGAYMDGLEMWKLLFEGHVVGVVRGDEAFGGDRVSSPSDVMRWIRADRLSDYSNLGGEEWSGLPPQAWPDNLRRTEGESLPAWRDRMHREYYMPAFLAALNDLKSSYVELVNPLVSRTILEAVCRLPDALREGRVLYKSIVKSLSPNIGFATRPAVAHRADVLRSPRVVAHVSQELDDRRCRDLLSDALVDAILPRLKVDDARWRTHRRPPSYRIESLVRQRVRDLTGRGAPRPPMDFNLLAFRAYIICRMNEILSEDAGALKSTAGASRKTVVSRPGFRVEDSSWRW
jgi:hypothetical protein